MGYIGTIEAFSALGRRRRLTAQKPSPIRQAAAIAAGVADVLTRLNVDDIPDLDAAATYLREAARLANSHVPATACTSRRYRHTVRDISRRLQELR